MHTKRIVLKCFLNIVNQFNKMRIIFYFVFGREGDMPLKRNGDKRYDGRRTNATQRDETMDQKPLVYAVNIDGTVLWTGNGQIQFRGDGHAGDGQIVAEKRLERFGVGVVRIGNVPHDRSTVSRTTDHVPSARVQRQTRHDVWKEQNRDVSIDGVCFNAKS